MSLLDDQYGNKVGIGTSRPSEKLEVAGAMKATAFNFNGSTITSWPSGGGGIGGSGTDNYIPRWNGTGALENSAIYQSDTGNVGIGTMNPKHFLHIDREGATSYGLMLGKDSSIGDNYNNLSLHYAQDWYSLICFKSGRYDSEWHMGFHPYNNEDYINDDFYIGRNSYYFLHRSGKCKNS